MLFSQLPSADVLRDLLLDAERRGLDDSILKKLRVIVAFANGQGSMSDICRAYGIARSTFHRWMERFDPRDLTTLQDRSREGLSPRTSTIDAETIDMVRRYRMRYPLMGKEKIAEMMSIDGMNISASTVGRIIERECLYFADTPYHWKKRMTHRSVQDDLYSPSIDSQESTLHSCDAGPCDAIALQQEVHPSIEPKEGAHAALMEHQAVPRQVNNNIVHHAEPLPVSMRNRVFTPWLRFGVIVSVIVNVVIVGVLLVSAVIESGMVEGSYPTESTLHAAPSAIILNQ